MHTCCLNSHDKKGNLGCIPVVSTRTIRKETLDWSTTDVYCRLYWWGVTVTSRLLSEWDNQSWNFQICPEVQNCPSLLELKRNSFKLRCNFQVNLWFDIVTLFGIQKPQSQFCTSFFRWIAVIYFSSCKLRWDMRKFQVWRQRIEERMSTAALSISPSSIWTPKRGYTILLGYTMGQNHPILVLS